jgi:hypothetical protein
MIWIPWSWSWSSAASTAHAAAAAGAVAIVLPRRSLTEHDLILQVFQLLQLLQIPQIPGCRALLSFNWTCARASPSGERDGTEREQKRRDKTRGAEVGDNDLNEAFETKVAGAMQDVSRSRGQVADAWWQVKVVAVHEARDETGQIGGGCGRAGGGGGDEEDDGGECGGCGGGNADSTVKATPDGRGDLNESRRPRPESRQK